MRVYRWRVSWTDETSHHVTDHAASGIWTAADENEAEQEIMDYLSSELDITPETVYGFSVVEDESGRLE